MLLFILNHKYLSLLLKLVNGISWPAKIMGHPFNRYTKLSTGSMKFQHNKLILHVGNTPAFLAAFADTFNSFTTSSTFCFFLDSDDVKINTFVSTSSHFKTILKWYHGNYILKNSNTMSIFYICRKWNTPAFFCCLCWYCFLRFLFILWRLCDCFFHLLPFFRFFFWRCKNKHIASISSHFKTILKWHHGIYIKNSNNS